MTIMVELFLLEKDLIETLYGLDNLRRTFNAFEWKEFCTTEITQFPLHAKLLLDPFTRFAFEQRKNGWLKNYLISDYLLRNNHPHYFPGGGTLQNFVTESDTSKAISHRRSHLYQLLDELAENAIPTTSILSVYSGLVVKDLPVRNRPQETFHVYDQDKKIDNLSEAQLSHLGIKSIIGSLNEFPYHHQLFNQYDFVYSLELLNQSNCKNLRSLIEQLFNRVKTGGRLFLTAFREHVSNTLYRTYFEAFAYWFLRYYTDEELIGLFSGIDPKYIEDFQLTTDPFCNIAYILIKKGKHSS